MAQALTIRLPHNVRFLPDDKVWENKIEIKSSSSNRLYVVSQHKIGRYWGCSCPGWKGHKNCHHLRDLGLPCYMKPYEAKLTQ